jgi:EamA domain-containing membrane protein RarD
MFERAQHPVVSDGYRGSWSLFVVISLLGTVAAFGLMAATSGGFGVEETGILAYVGGSLLLCVALAVTIAGIRWRDSVPLIFGEILIVAALGILTGIASMDVVVPRATSGP